MRKAKIVATIGPATESSAMLEKIICAGVDVCRLNFSFGTHEEHLEKIRRIRAAARKAGKAVAILQDLQGPKIRIGILKHPVTIRRGDTVTLTGKTVHEAEFVLPTTYPSIANDTKVGKTILLADGKIILKVTAVRKHASQVVCKTVCGGTILSGKGINLPYTDISLPAITEKDEADAEFGIRAGVDFIGMSFIRKPQDVRKLHTLFQRLNCSVPVIAKIEKPEALDNLDPILDAVDGVMVARGDLAVELSYSKVPAAQKRILHQANRKGKLTIIATEMLSSMVENPLPTRAEVSDVANGVWDHSDCLMLSNESAMGRYPVDSVKAMAQIISDTEQEEKSVFRHGFTVIEALDLPEAQTPNEAVCKAAAKLSYELPVRGMVVISSTGRTVRTLAKYRPAAPVYAFCFSEELYNRLGFCHNVCPILLPPSGELTDEWISCIVRMKKLARPGEQMICLRGANISEQWALQGLSILTLPGGKGKKA